ncbi:hypothetical protein Pla100_56930 [Neorhodopirellula pilleata]|uniref:Uncharacterized protein n=1 Tax=Neorhodopirellula pilleata TaxID=2714738 RepID=A0A5C5ZQ66_9BACT|nr:hypothetical protein Pla100_56930 [Neorhodopirellula pilleata]
MLCPNHRKADGSPMELTQPEINSIAGCPIKREQIRRRLSDLSWWMRLLCQRVAMPANREDEEHGRFFQDRYKATRFGSSILFASLIGPTGRLWLRHALFSSQTPPDLAKPKPSRLRCRRLLLNQGCSSVKLHADELAKCHVLRLLEVPRRQGIGFRG